jgi:4-hydroxybenzoate polyprenyltransferase
LLKYYFQLFRVSNIFTVPPDILAGYFISIINNNTGAANYHYLVILLSSSIFLYVGGLATNDLFDFDIDKKQRPNRPLPSGNIRKRTTAILSVLFLGAGLFLSLFVSVTSTIVSVLLVVMILSYNYRLKNGVLRPFLMGGIRALNVIYGSTSNYGFSLSSSYFYGMHGIDYSVLISLTVATLAAFIHIFTLTLISARETVEEMSKFKKLIDLKSIFFGYLFLFILITSTGIIFLPNKILFLSFIIVFLAAVSFIFYKKGRIKRPETQDIIFIVKNMIVLLIVLDASFVAGVSGFYWGIITASLTIPCVIIGKKIQMT